MEFPTFDAACAAIVTLNEQAERGEVVTHAALSSNRNPDGTGEVSFGLDCAAFSSHEERFIAAAGVLGGKHTGS